jgi:hypothetical protein
MGHDLLTPGKRFRVKLVFLYLCPLRGAPQFFLTLESTFSGPLGIQSPKEKAGVSQKGGVFPQ